MINPENIHCLALNYKGVGKSAELPLYFVKSKSCLCFSTAKIEYPSNVKKLWTEVELGIVINQDCYNVAEKDAGHYIEGFVVCADITAENICGRDHHLGYSKSRKYFCPVSSEPKLIEGTRIYSLELITEINGKTTQKGCLKDMYFNPFKSLSYISSITELRKGDLILTGTPAGVENNVLKKGDRVNHFIDEIGKLSYDII